MRYTQSVADYGVNRLTKVLSDSKRGRPEDVKEVLKSDVKKVVQNYIEIDGDMKVEIRENSDGFSVLIRADAKRIKPIGIISRRY